MEIQNKEKRIRRISSKIFDALNKDEHYPHLRYIPAHTWCKFYITTYGRLMQVRTSTFNLRVSNKRLESYDCICTLKNHTNFDAPIFLNEIKALVQVYD